MYYQKLHRVLLCLCAAALAGVSAADVLAETAPQLRITEIMYDAPGVDGGHEWVEIMNVGDAPADIDTSHRLFDGSYHTLTHVTGTPHIEPGGFAIIADNAETWLAAHSGFAGTVFDTVLSLKNTSSTVGLATTTGGALYSGVTYDSAWGGSGNGKTLERAHDDVSSFSAVPWVESAALGGTPGAWGSLDAGDTTTTPTSTEDSTPVEEPVDDEPVAETEPGEDESLSEDDATANGEESADDTVVYSHDIHFSEVLPNPAGSDNAEWVELWNASLIGVDLVGWKLSDVSGKAYVINAEDGATAIPALGFLVLDRVRTGISLNNTGDELHLFAPDGSYRESASYPGSVPEAEAYAVFNSAWRWTRTPTPGAGNVLTVALLELEEDGDGDAGTIESDDLEVTAEIVVEQVEPRILVESDALRITEFMPNPEGSDEAEWIEVQNRSTSTVNLLGWQIDDAEGGSAPYTFPVTATIAPGGYLVIPREVSKIALNNNADEVRLIAPDTTIWQGVSYGKSASGLSYAYGEANDVWLWTTEATPGEPFVFIAPPADTPEVLGTASHLVEYFDLIDESLVNEEVLVRGAVVVPPDAISKQRMYLAEVSDDGYVPEGLLEVYQYRGDFPDLETGAYVQVMGTVSWVRERPRVKISGADDIVVENMLVLDAPEPRQILDIREDDERSWITIAAAVERASAKSLTLGDQDETMRVVVEGSVDFSDHAIEKGDRATITGFLQFSSGKPVLHVLYAGDVTIEQATAQFEESTADGADSRDTVVVTEAVESRDVTRPLLYLSTVPIVLGLGWVFRKYIAPKMR